MKHEPTKEETLEAIKDGVFHAFKHDQLFPNNFTEAVKDGVWTAFADSLANYGDINGAIRDSVEKAFKDVKKKLQDED